MIELVLIRHGEAEHLVGDGENRLTGGWTDSALTGKGLEQARDTANRLATMIASPQVTFCSSDLKRCKETAQIIGDFISAQPKFSKDLRELNNGLAANRTRREAKAIEIPVTEPVIDWAPYPGAESWAGMHERVVSFMERIKNEDSERTIIITHGGPIVAIIHWWLGLPRECWSTVSFDLEPCSVTRLTINRFGERTISKLNDTCHLNHQSKHNHWGVICRRVQCMDIRSCNCCR